MCVSSVISDYYQDTFPNRFPQTPIPNQLPNQSSIYLQDPEVKEMLKKLIELADKIDKKLGDVECHDESKEAFRKALGL